MSIIFNSVSQFVEQVGRRTTQRFGAVINYIFVYIGPQSGYSSWAKMLGSSPTGFPLLFLNNIEKRNLAGQVMEVTLYYVGTDQQGVQYTDLEIQTDLAFKSFSWSGLAEIASAITPFIAPLSLQFNYSTTEATFRYTTYKNQGALFGSLAPSYIGVQFSYLSTSYGAAQVGVGPRVGPPYAAIQTLTRHTCEQLTPNRADGSGVWRCSETWSMDYNMGSLGFPHP
jgi:hypothetical protein